MSQKEPKGTIWNTDLGKQDERTDKRTNERTNDRTDSVFELAGFYPAAKKSFEGVHCGAKTY